MGVHISQSFSLRQPSNCLKPFCEICTVYNDKIRASQLPDKYTLAGEKGMKIILTLDDSNGMLFNHRRQSSDRAVRDKIREHIKGEVLYMNAYSADQFKDTDIRMLVDGGFLHKADKGEYCFVENEMLSDVKRNIEEFAIFRWNRKYPSDFVLDVLPEDCGMTCVSIEEFVGNSHEKVTMEIWRPEY